MGLSCLDGFFCVCSSYCLQFLRAARGKRKRHPLHLLRSQYLLHAGRLVGYGHPQGHPLHQRKFGGSIWKSKVFDAPLLVGCRADGAAFCSARVGSGRGSHPPKTCFPLARFVGWLLTCVLCVRVCVLVKAKGKVKEQMSANQVCKRLWRQQGSGSPPQMSLGIMFAAGRVRKLVFACICMAPAALLQSWSLWADHYEAGGRADASASGSGASTAELLQPACDRPLATFPAFSSMLGECGLMKWWWREFSCVFFTVVRRRLWPGSWTGVTRWVWLFWHKSLWHPPPPPFLHFDIFLHAFCSLWDVGVSLCWPPVDSFSLWDLRLQF